MGISRTKVAAALVVVGTALSGCGGDDAADKLAEKIIEGQTGGDVKIDSDSGKVRVETEDGSITIEGDDESFEWNSDEGTIKGASDGSLPEGFPSDIPLPKWKLTNSMSMSSTDEGTTYSLTYETDGSAEDAIAEIASLYEDDGYTRTFLSSAGDAGAVGLTGDTWTVNATASPTDDNLLVQLIISPTPAE